MKAWKQSILRTPVIGPITLFGYRAKFAASYFRKPLSALLRWLFESNETTNFTYDLTTDSMRYMASMLALVLKSDYSTVLNYMDEADNDLELKGHIAATTAISPLAAVADREVRFGRRLGWYAVVRVLKPAVVIETGVDKGLGSCLLAAALLRNRSEGFEGRYYGTDINPEAGYLLSGEYAAVGEIRYGDSIETLASFESKIDLFINDSDHSADYEAAEYETIANKLSDSALVLGDNSHVTDKLLQFSLKHDRRFLFFAEAPDNHWYPGGGIGVSFAEKM
ncbi:class I SAM-dependent methyltransferase [Mycolicibacterium neoaurum]|uniref:class I SAM-dependent methyltransferase n=1 Tax=Mycolicibacterium neoaurum TaxID=1795 RepID=UPI00248C3FCB|nr:class I SAM-dependent methyltransferase [Mycolicibacterium neoaurum]WBP96208.1 class I SAM-dependent methyltransferase [Mycolicibacterium neoaurum]WBS10261.1 class I SAM-dependent methyltransferase [Mycolicibacterium neoaurum]